MCKCNVVGSVNGSCTMRGDCFCRAGVTGQKCDQCAVKIDDKRADDVLLLYTTVSVLQSDLCPTGSNISVKIDTSTSP